MDGHGVLLWTILLIGHAVEVEGIHQSRPRGVVTYSGQRKLIGGS
jgi:hypothetical protein